jgi:hypothetical protein
MYPKIAAGGALPLTGFMFGWKVVAAASLLLAGAAILRLLPTRRRSA